MTLLSGDQLKRYRLATHSAGEANSKQKLGARRPTPCGRPERTWGLGY